MQAVEGKQEINLEWPKVVSLAKLPTIKIKSSTIAIGDLIAKNPYCQIPEGEGKIYCQIPYSTTMY